MVRFVLLAEALVDAALVLPNASVEIARDTDIMAAGLAAYDINPSAMLDRMGRVARSFDSGSS